MSLERSTSESGTSAAKRRAHEPLSIEHLLQQQKEEREANAKVWVLGTCKEESTEAVSQPRFLSKEERAKLAIEKRAQEIKEQREKEERQRKEREVLEVQAAALRRQGDNDRHRGGPSRDPGQSMLLLQCHLRLPETENFAPRR